MKNKIVLFIIYIFIIFLMIAKHNVLAEKISFKAKKILTFDSSEIIVGEEDTEVDIDDRIKIFADKYSYFKNKDLVIVEGNIRLIDFIDEIKLNSQLIHYNIKKKEFVSYGDTEINIKEKYEIKSNNIHYNYLKKIIFSDAKIYILDKFMNKITAKKYTYSIDSEIVKGNNFELTDNKDNKYILKNGMIDLKNNLILGKDINILLRNDIFGDKDNQPRLVGNSISYKDNLTTINKGIFTSCKNVEGKCPSWSITSDKIVHDKLKQEIRYSNSVIKIYDVPVAYFPKFFHPDPTVKRKSGFLSPTMGESRYLGASVIIPYYQVISNESDFTFQPRLFSNNEFLLRSEYRKKTKNSSNIIDFSLNKSDEDNKEGRKSHFFLNSKVDLNFKSFNESNLFFKLEKVSNDEYTKMYSLEKKDSIVNDTSILESSVRFSGTKNKFNFDLSFESYETMHLANNDRYEFIYPNYSLSKIFDNVDDGGFIDKYTINSHGSQKKRETNVYEAEQINDFIINTNSFNNNFGVSNDLEVLFKNVNSLGQNSSKFKNNEQSEFLTQIIYNLSLPMIKKEEEYSNFLTPKLSFRYSPNDTKNFSNETRYINANNIFNSNRIGIDQGIEGGSSLTFGLNYNRTDNYNNDILSYSIATVFKDQVDNNIPITSTIGEKQSDIVGNLKISPNQLIEINYDYSLDSNNKDINLHNLKSKFSIKNFVYEFNYFEENNIIGNENYYENSLIYNFDENKSFSFNSRENKKTNITEFYNLIYQYKNDCLTASIQYNKDYYFSGNLKPNEELFFLINLKPLGSTQSENLINIK